MCQNVNLDASLETVRSRTLVNASMDTNELQMVPANQNVIIVKMESARLPEFALACPVTPDKLIGVCRSAKGK